MSSDISHRDSCILEDNSTPDFPDTSAIISKPTNRVGLDSTTQYYGPSGVLGSLNYVLHSESPRTSYISSKPEIQADGSSHVSVRILVGMLRASAFKVPHSQSLFYEAYESKVLYQLLCRNVRLSTKEQTQISKNLISEI